MGETLANQPPAITVSGLKPNHFYNVRVIAVGQNNFQAGSRVIRLRTFDPDGRPQLGNSRLPSNFQPEEHGAHGHGEHGDENGTPRSSVPSVETVTSTTAVATMARETTASGPSGRRTTSGRWHSPSTTSLDGQQLDGGGGGGGVGGGDPSGQSEATIVELTATFNNLVKETEDTAILIAKEEEENRRLLEELESEKQGKRKEQKRKEEQTEKLKRELGTTDRTMRNALQRKSQKEKALRERQAKLTRYHEDILKWEKHMEDMKSDQDGFVQQREELEEDRHEKARSLRDDNSDLQAECSRLEAELKDKRDRVKEMEDARKKLPGGEDDGEWREKMMELRRDWQRRERDYQGMLIHENRRARHLDEHLHVLSVQLQQIPQTSSGFYNEANSSGVDFETSSQNQIKRRSRNSTSLSNVAAPSPVSVYAMAADQSVAASTGFSHSRPAAPPGFAQGPYMDLSADNSALDDAGLRALTAGAPLSPSATSLLPSGIFADDEPQSPTSKRPARSPVLLEPMLLPGDDPQSPASSNRSLSIMSSPRSSLLNLPYYAKFPVDTSDRRSMRSGHDVPGPVSSPPAAPPSGHRLGNIFSLRGRAAKWLDDDGPALGTLKQGQSQSFPRQVDESEALSNRRRISLSTWGMFNRNSAGPELLEGHAVSKGFSARSLIPFTSSRAAIFSERDPSSPRPASIASSDMPRPSTDSSSIWGPPGEAAALVGKPSRLWSPDNAWSRNPSRRPSLHGSPSALKTTLASADDEILDEEALLNPDVSPSQVGVIGSRPAISKRTLQQSLNPAAPNFVASLFQKKPDREKEPGKDKTARLKAEKERSKERLREAKEKFRGTQALTPGHEASATMPPLDESPSDSRMSRDTLSVHTRTSVSESRESLSLDYSLSNTPSDPNNTAATIVSSGGGSVSSSKDPENAVRKLFRKGSSSKFSFSSRLSKKGPGSVANSDKNMSAERSSFGDLDDLASFLEGLPGGGVGVGVGAPAVMTRSYDSITSSPSLGPSKSKGSEGGGGGGGASGAGSRISGRWFGPLKKKAKEKESLDLDREKAFDLPEAPGEDDKRA